MPTAITVVINGGYSYPGIGRPPRYLQTFPKSYTTSRTLYGPTSSRSNSDLPRNELLQPAVRVLDIGTPKSSLPRPLLGAAISLFGLLNVSADSVPRIGK